MKIKNKIKQHAKLVILIGISLVLVMSSATVYSIKNNSLYHTSSHLLSGTMLVENTSAWPGDTDHLIHINGTWDEDITYYQMGFYFDNSQIEIAEVNLQGCVGENYLGGFNWFVVPQSPQIDILIAYVEYSTVPPYIPPGEGPLFNVIINIFATALPGQTILDIDPYFCIYRDSSFFDFHPTCYDGFLAILSNSPQTPTQPNGPTEGEIEVEYEFSTATIEPDGDDVYYQWDWGDEISEWMGPYPPNQTVTVSHTWFEPGEYNIKVKAKDEFGFESDWSDPLTIAIGGPVLEIEITSWFIGLNVKISNVGISAATDVECHASVQGGIFGLIGLEENYATDTLPSGESIYLKFTHVIGFGKILVTAEASASNADQVNETKEGFILLFIIIF